MILLFKLIEIFQYLLLALILAGGVSNFLNNTVFPYVIKSSNLLYLKMMGYLFILSSISYFITKYIPKIPFLFHRLGKSFGYITSMKNENIRGAEIGAGLLFYSHQTTFRHMMNELF